VICATWPEAISALTVTRLRSLGQGRRSTNHGTKPLSYLHEAGSDLAEYLFHVRCAFASASLSSGSSAVKRQEAGHAYLACAKTSLAAATATLHWPAE